MKTAIARQKLNSQLLADEVVHFSSSLLIGIVLATIFSSPVLIIFSLLMGFFIDGDHLVDYFYRFFHLDKKTIRKRLFSFRFHLKHFFQPDFYVQGSKKVFVPLHGWEYLIIFWLILRFWGQKLGWSGLEWTTLAYLAHLAWDQHTCAGHWRSYFFSHRLLNCFSYNCYCRFSKTS